MKDRKFKSGVLVGVASTILVMGLLVGITIYKNMYLLRLFVPSTQISQTIEDSEKTIFSKIKYLMNIIDTQSIYKPDDEAVIEGIYKGIFSSLDDDYAAYFTKEDYAKFMETSNGEYVGIRLKKIRNICILLLYIG